MPQLGNTSVFPEAADVYVTVTTAVISYKTPIAYISNVVRLTSDPDVDIVTGAESNPQWGQG
jgi:hypothetical protein